MLEIPESQVIAKQLNDTIKGKTIYKVIAGASPHGFAFYYGEPEDYPFRLEGKIVGEAQAIGGQVEISIEDMNLTFGDGANIRYIEDEKKLPAKHQLLIEFEDHTYLVVTVQMYGSMMAFKKGENDNFYYLVAKEKPMPLSKEFTEDYFLQLFDGLKENTSVKALLATEQRIPGVGNGTLQDILFCAKMNPKMKIGALTLDDKKKIYHCIQSVLKEIIDNSGRDTEKDLFGNTGGYMTVMSSKGIKEPCPVCGSTIIKKAYMGGNVYYCPKCQP